MSASIRSRAALFAPVVAILMFLTGCPETPDLGEIRPPQPPPDFSIKVDLGFEEGEATVDDDGVITVGSFPVTAKFRGGVMAVPDNPDLVRERQRAYLVAEGDTAEITFTSPAKSFQFFFRHEFDPPPPDAAAARATRQVQCGVFDLGLNNGAAFGGQVYARGGFNGWAGVAADPPSNFVNNGDGTYAAEFEMVAGSYGFKIAVEDWSTEYSNEGSESLVPDTPIAFPLSGAGSGNSTVEIPADACYTWTISNIDESATPTPSFTLEIAEKVEGGPGGGAAGSEVRVYDTYGDEISTIPGSTLYKLVGVDVDTDAGDPLISRIEIANISAAPNVRAMLENLEKTRTRQVCGVDDQGNDNTESFGKEMSVRGSLNDWGFGPPTNLVNFGSGNFQAEFDLTAGSYEFKIASEDWTVEYTDDASPVVVESPSMINLSAGGSGNTMIDIPADGCWNWSVDVVDDSSSPAPTIELTVTLVTDDDGPTGDTGVGLVAIDGFSFRADPQATRTINIVYARPDGDFSGTEITVSGADLASGNQTLACEPVFGLPGLCTVRVRLIPGGSFQYSITNDGVPDPSGLISVNAQDISPDNVVITFAGSAVPNTRGIPVAPLADEVVLFYKRNDDNYDGWGLHLFPIGSTDWTNFTGGEYPPSGVDPLLGAYFIIGLPGSPRLSEPYSRCASASTEPGCDLDEFPASLGFIIHNGDNKDPGPDQFVNIAEDGNVIFVRSGVNSVSTTPPVDGGVVLADAAAHWVTADTLVWSHGPGVDSVQLLSSATAGIREAGGRLINVDQSFDLSPGSRPDLPGARHLEGRTAYAVPADAFAAAGDLVKGQLLAVALDAEGNQVKATRVQFPLLLDALYAEAAADAQLGVIYNGGAPTLSVWAPTSNSVTVNIFDAPDADTPSDSLPMSFDAATGIWSIEGSADWDRKYYTYTLNNYAPTAARLLDQQVTDPYSVNLSMASDGRLVKSQIVNLDDSDLKPLDWDTFSKPPLAAPEDIAIYELHVRDFSALDDSVATADQGKFSAFAASGAGTEHLATAAAAGMTHVHVLPAFDIATINEDAGERVDITAPIDDLCAINPAAQSYCDDFSGMTIVDVLDSFDAGDSQQQQLVGLLRGFDSFNWGYDPYHFNAVEGSYSSDPDGVARIVEFRGMVKGLSDLGLRTILDTVYNHTNASGHLSDRSVLDKVVPGYYHRLDPNSGGVLRDSCCDDTAAEHAMMSKFIVDSALHWAKHYKIDGFRFDLMSFHPLSTMEQVRDSLQALTLADDGVDGSAIYLYGEGWNFGAIENDQRFVAARQDNLAGTGLGSFNDRIRDAVRGGGPFDSGQSHIDNKGFTSGLHVDAGASNAAADRIRIAMTGGLAAFPFTDANDNSTTGGGIGAGYTADPQEIINYVASHDGETLWDIAQYKHPFEATTADRVRAHNVANAIVLLGQGVPFFHAGQELLRSKSMDRNSFDSGDWFNFLDFSAMDNNFGVGLPPSGDNQASYTQIGQVLGIAAAEPGAGDIMLARSVAEEFLRIRSSSQLFRLRTANDVINRVKFHNTGSAQVPGLIVMSIDGCVQAGYTPEFGSVVTVINARPDEQVFNPFGPVRGGSLYNLHPVQAESVDLTVAAAFYDSDGFHVPGRTAAVFVSPQGNATCGFGADFANEMAFITGDGFNSPMVQVDGTTIYEGTVALPVAMDQRYRIQSADMAAIDCGGPTGGGPLFTPVGAATTIQCGGGPDELSVDSDTEGRYKFSLDISNVIAPTLDIRAQTGAGFPVAGDGCGIASAGNDDTEAFGAEMFVRGGFNNWGNDPFMTAPPYQLINVGDGYEAEFEIDAGPYEFKLADAGWTIEYSSEGPVTVGEVTSFPNSAGGSGNSSIAIADNGCYNWRFDVVDDTSVPAPLLDLTVSFVPQSGGEPTADPLIRGGFNDWGEGPMDMIDTTTFEGVVSVAAAGTYEFKVASSDWATVNCGAPAVLGGAMDVAANTPTVISCGDGTGNLRADFAQAGDYAFTVDSTNRNNPTLTFRSFSGAGFNSGGPRQPTVYLKADVNSFGLDNPTTANGTGINYFTTVALPAGPQQFRLESEDGTTISCGTPPGGNANVSVGVESGISCGDNIANLEVDIEAAGDYRFFMTISGSGTPLAPRLTITQL